MEDTSLLHWMAWTWPTAVFFIFVLLCLCGMSVWEYYSQGGSPRRGILGLDTTRGDRLFLSLLGAAFVHLIFLGFFGADVLFTLPRGDEGIDVSRLWIATVISLLGTAAVFRWV
jgi:predicted small integral membrane protein